MSRSALPVVLLACAVAVGAAPAQEAVIERAGKHFHIVCHPGGLAVEPASALADASLAVVEAAWPVLQRLLPGEPPAPPPIHLYCSTKDYRAIENKCPLHFHVNGFTTAERAGHVLLWPELAPKLLARIGLPAPTADWLLRVAAEQAVRPLVDDTADGRWLCDLIALGVVETLTNPRQKPGVDSCYDQRRVEAIEQGVGARLMLAEMTRLGDLDNGFDQWTMRQAALAVLSQHLASLDAAWVRKLLRQPRQGKGRDARKSSRAFRLEEVIGTDWPKAETRFGKTCASLQAIWDVQAPLWQVGPQRSLLAGTKAGAASIWAQAPTPKGEYAISGTVEFGPCTDTPNFRVQLGWDGKTMLGVHCNRDNIHISVWDDAAQKWSDGPQQPIALPEGAPFRFRIEVTATEVRLSIGKQLLAWAHGGRELHTSWGFAANDAIVWLQDLRIEALPAAGK